MTVGQEVVQCSFLRSEFSPFTRLPALRGQCGPRLPQTGRCAKLLWALGPSSEGFHPQSLVFLSSFSL